MTWSVQEAGGGTVSSSGVYTAPASAGEYHVIARQLGPVVAVSPPLVISEAEIKRLGAAMRDAVSRLQPDGTFSPAASQKMS